MYLRIVILVITLGMFLSMASDINQPNNLDSSIKKLIKNAVPDQVTRDISLQALTLRLGYYSILNIQTAVDNAIVGIGALIASFIPDINISEFVTSILTPVITYLDTLASTVQTIPVLYFVVEGVSTILTVANTTIGVFNFTTTNVTSAVIIGVQTVVDSIFTIIEGLVI
ncbi:uncharacterized protein LOC115885939 [Sitophilus oryzae]|uniref:Uncharacterized protein LOC115885939 n=1 Tax=Sitophilus oryzae TaxID=7048 RepID=A0A6J2YBJ6_SITOR|nr:uncharacterized protein LOC115885939 [Sitophilus oryzae]